MLAHPVVNLSEGVAPSARLQNRTGEFPRIRLHVPALANIIAYVLAILLMFGSAWLMGIIGGRSVIPQRTMQAGQYPLPPLPVSSSSFEISPPSTPQAYGPQPSPRSALEIVQQRFARGEIDAQMYQEMRAQLEASARPNP